MLDASLAAVDQLQVDALVVGLCEDERPLAGIAAYVDWRLCGRLSDMLRRGEITGRRGETVLAKTDGQAPFSRLFFFGWGPRAALLDGAAERLRVIVDTLEKARVQSVAIALPEPGSSLLGLVEEHLEKPLGSKLHGVFLPDEKLAALRETRPVPMPALDKPAKV